MIGCDTRNRAYGTAAIPDDWYTAGDSDLLKTRTTRVDGFYRTENKGAKKEKKLTTRSSGRVRRTLGSVF